MVSIAVGTVFGPRTKGEEWGVSGAALAAGVDLLTGGVKLSEPLTPGWELVYNSNTLPKPIVVLETFLRDDSAVPEEIEAQLTFNGTAGTTYGYDTTGLEAGETLRFALQADGTSLATGRYEYEVELTANEVGQVYEGSQHVVNRGASTHPFGRGWQLAGLESLVIESEGVLWVRDDGAALWFAEDGSGGYEAAEGDVAFASLVEASGAYTLTDKHGNESHFDSTGKLTSREDRNGNTITYTYSSGLLVQITDAFERDTTFTYTGGRLTAVTDFAGRTATLTYDTTNGRLTKITQPDPDGAGALAAPETEFTYDSSSHRLTKVTDPLDRETQYAYGSHGRLTTITNSDSSTRTLAALQTIGLPTGTSGNSLTSANPQGTLTDERGKQWKFRTDRFGNLVEWKDPNNNQTLTERNADGLPVRVTEQDPDSSGPLAAPVTILGYDESGNLVSRENGNHKVRMWTYTGTFNHVASETDELGETRSFSYDSNGNLTSATDELGYVTAYEYDAQGLVTSITTPDPDGAGPLSAAETTFDYDGDGRLETITYPDATTKTFTYDSADNLLTETDELDHTTTFTYDALARLTSREDREEAVTTFVYDAAGQLTKMTDANGTSFFLEAVP